MRNKSSSSVRIFYPKFSKTTVIEEIRKTLDELRKELPLKKVILFGSYAKGNYTAASDVDVLVVYSGKERGNAYALCKKTLKIPRLEPHVYSEREYRGMKETVDRMARNGTVLFSG
jgi:predicted nucleotidyltransferase